MSKREQRDALCQRVRTILGGGPATTHELADLFIEVGVETRRVDSMVRYYIQQGYHEPTHGLQQVRLVRTMTALSMSASGYPCHYCGAPAEHIDHVWPRSRGGDDHPNNLVRACRACNSSKGSKSILTDACPVCGQGRDPSDVDTATGVAYYHCRCGAAWHTFWDLQRVSLVA